MKKYLTSTKELLKKLWSDVVQDDRNTEEEIYRGNDEQYEKLYSAFDIIINNAHHNRTLNSIIVHINPGRVTKNMYK